MGLQEWAKCGIRHHNNEAFQDKAFLETKQNTLYRENSRQDTPLL